MSRTIGALLVALLVLSVTAPAAGASVDPDARLSLRDFRDAVEQAVVTAHHDVRTGPQRWTDDRRHPATTRLRSSVDMRPSGRWWARQVLDGACGPDVLLCHNVPPYGPGYHTQIGPHAGAGENASLRWFPSTQLTRRGAEQAAEGIMRGLANSPGHLNNIMNPRYDDFGVGVHVDDDGRMVRLAAIFVYRVHRDGAAYPAPPQPDLGTSWQSGLVARNFVPVAPATLPATAARGTDRACPNSREDAFTDVSGVLGRQLSCAHELGVASGYPDGTFRPGQALTRAHAAAFIVRLLDGLDVPLPAPRRGFADVPADHTQAEPIGRLVAMGLVSGYADGTFRPNHPVTRQQYLAMVDRAMERVADYPNGWRYDEHFADVSLAHAPAVDRLATLGIVASPQRGRLDAGGAMTRGEAAAIKARAADVIAEVRSR